MGHMRGTAKERREFFKNLLGEVEYFSERESEERARAESSRGEDAREEGRPFDFPKAREDDGHADQWRAILKKDQKWIEENEGNVAVIVGKRIEKVLETPSEAMKFAEKRNYKKENTLVVLI